MSEDLRYYHDPITRGICEPKEVRALPRERQVAIAEEWFNRNYETPSFACPRDSDGTFVFIFGGPYDVKTELAKEFHDQLAEDVIDEVVARIDPDGPRQWSGAPYEEDYLFKTDFDDSLDAVRELLNQSIDPAHEKTFYRLVFVQAIALMEAYLSTNFIRLVQIPEALKKFVETHPEIQREKISLLAAIDGPAYVTKRVVEFLREQSFHSLWVVQNMYKDTFGCCFPEELTRKLYPRVLIRHHIVHRAGRDHDGNEVKVDRQDVESLLTDLSEFIQKIEIDLMAYDAHHATPVQGEVDWDPKA